MLVDRYPREDVFARVPELAAQTDPVLKELDHLLDDDELYQSVRADLGKRYRWTLVHGRHSTPVEVLLRKHLYGWSYRETEERVKDSLVLRWFCRVYFETVPDETTLLRWLRTLRPETLQETQRSGGGVGEESQSDEGAQVAARWDLRANRDPSPQVISGLLVDGVRVLSRVVHRAKDLLKDQGEKVKALCRSRLRTAKQVAQTLHRQLRRKGEEKEAEQKELYQKLIKTTEQMVQQSREVVKALSQQTEQQAKPTQKTSGGGLASD
jgi:IS5 family transposase